MPASCLIHRKRRQARGVAHQQQQPPPSPAAPVWQRAGTRCGFYWTPETRGSTGDPRAWAMCTGAWPQEACCFFPIHLECSL